MDLPLDARIDAAHVEAERIEAESRQLEARILATGARIPTRRYGRPVDAAELAKNLTSRSLICKRDPALASYLGLQDGSYRREQEERAAREAAAARMAAQTEALRGRNAAQRQQREQRLRAGLNPSSGLRMI